MCYERLVPTFEPIGVVHSPFKEKRTAPRQGTVLGAQGTIEIFGKDGYLHALSDIDGFERLIILFHFHEAEHFRPKVLPPRSSVRRGVLATRSPHRPNPIGLTVVRLLGVRGLCLDVADLDILDGTPVLDVKPYIPYADAFPAARAGWLDDEAGRIVNAESTSADGTTVAREAKDPIAAYEVRFTSDVAQSLAWLASRGRDLELPLRQALALGPAPHPYRRIRVKNGVPQIAVKDFRATFAAQGKVITVTSVFSGYSPKELATAKGDELDLHRAFESQRARPTT